MDNLQTMNNSQLLDHQAWLLKGWFKTNNPKLADQVTVISDELLRRVKRDGGLL